MRTSNVLHIVFCSALFLAAGVLSAADAPEAVYQKFHDAMLNGDMDTILQLSPASIRAEMAAYPPEQNKEGLAMMTELLLPKTFSVLGFEPGADANATTLYASGMGHSLMSDEPEKHYGTISMVKEGGDWKVGGANWNNKPPKNLPKSPAPATAAASAAPPAPAAPVVPDATTPVPAAPVAPAATAAPAAPSPDPGVDVPPAQAAPVAAAAPAPTPPKPPEKKKPVCIIKQVMSNAEIEACRQAAAEELTE